MVLPNSPLSFCQANDCPARPVVKIDGLGAFCLDHWHILTDGLEVYTRDGWSKKLPGLVVLNHTYVDPYPEFPRIVDQSEPDPYVGG